MLSAQNKKTRASGIGSSEIGIIAGFSPHSSIHELWLEKTGLAPRADNDSYAVLVGQYLEPGAAKLYERITGRELVNTRRTYRHTERKWQLATPDRFVPEEQQRLVEIKVPGRWAKGWDFRLKELPPRAFTPEEWYQRIKTEEDGLPAHVLCQVQWQMDVTGIHLCDVFAVAGTEPHIFEVAYDADMAGHLREIGEKFWRDNVLAKTPPAVDGSKDAGRAIAYRWRQKTQAMLPASPEASAVAEQLRAMRSRAKSLAEQAAVLQQELCVMIGEAAGIEGVCTWQEHSRGAIAWKPLAEELMALLERVRVADAFRFDRFLHEAGHPQPIAAVIEKHRGAPKRHFLLKGENNEQ